jgi:EpsI family protein
MTTLLSKRWRHGRVSVLSNFRAYLPAALLAIGVFFVFQTRSQMAMPLAQPLSTVLQGLEGQYLVQHQKVSDEERRVAGMSDYTARIYRHADSTVAFTTLVSYYEKQAQGKTIHSPRNCLPGAGWEILNGAPRVVYSGGTAYRVNRFVLKNGAATSVAYYWYQGRGRVASNEYVVKWNLLRDAALVGHTEEALVRIVVPVVTPSKTVVKPTEMDAAAMERKFAAADSLAGKIADQLIRDVRQALPASDAAGQAPVRQTALQR